MTCSFDNDENNIGVFLSMLFTSPNWPKLLYPQDNTSPFDVNTNVWLLPHLISTTSSFDTDEHNIGVFWCSVFVSPNWE